MLKGKVVQDRTGRFHVQVGAVTVDVTESVEMLLAEQRTTHVQALADLQARYADVTERYTKIQHIVFAGGAGMPTG